MNTSEQDNNLQPTTDNVELTKSSNYYDELLEYLEENPLHINVPERSEDFINSKIPSCTEYNFAVPKHLTDPKLILELLGISFGEEESVAYEFTYYDCAYTVIDINENGEYHGFYIKLFKLSNPDVRYYISIQQVTKRYSYYFKDFCALVESFFDKTKTIEIFEVLPNFGLELEDDVKMEDRVSKYFKNLVNPEPTNESLHPYWIDKHAIEPLTNFSANSDANEYFTSDRLSMLLKFWESIEKYDNLLLTSTRCAIIIYNILLTESILDDVTPLIDYCLKIAKEEGNLWDEHLRLKACQIIKIIVNKNYNITDEKRNEITYFFDGLVEKNHKFIKKLSLN
jgi:hypothetical protein